MDREVITWHSGTEDFLTDLLELRHMVEPEAAALAAAWATDEQIATLEEAYAGMALYASRLPDDEEAFVAADLKFHLTLLRASGNQLVQQLGRLLEPGLHHGLEASSHAPGGVVATLPLHRAVLLAVRGHRPTAAAKAMRKLIETTSSAVQRMIEES
jgi:DNA-binding FadR family transcriptional regulator